MKKILNYIPSMILTVLFIIWTVLVKTIDVSYIKDIGYLGFYHFNTLVSDSVREFARSELFDKLTDVGLYLSMAVAIFFIVLFIVQWAKRKSIKKVDKVLFALLTAYVVSGAYYLIFEIVKINYSPLSTYDELKASYPSTHVLLFIVLMVTGLIALFNYVKVNKVLRVISYSILGALVIVYCAARLYSLNHYFSDIIGSILLSASIVALFIALNRSFNKSEPSEKVEELPQE